MLLIFQLVLFGAFFFGAVSFIAVFAKKLTVNLASQVPKLKFLPTPMLYSGLL